MTDETEIEVGDYVYWILSRARDAMYPTPCRVAGLAHRAGDGAVVYLLALCDGSQRGVLRSHIVATWQPPPVDPERLAHWLLG